MYLRVTSVCQFRSGSWSANGDYRAIPTAQPHAGEHEPPGDEEGPRKTTWGSCRATSRTGNWYRLLQAGAEGLLALPGAGVPEDCRRQDDRRGAVLPVPPGHARKGWEVAYGMAEGGFGRLTPTRRAPGSAWASSPARGAHDTLPLLLERTHRQQTRRSRPRGLVELEQITLGSGDQRNSTTALRRWCRSRSAR